MDVRKTFLSALAACFGLALFVASCAKPTTSGTSCATGQTDCSGQCINTKGSDPQNCGACQDLRRGLDVSGRRLRLRRRAAQLQQRLRPV